MPSSAYKEISGLYTQNTFAQKKRMQRPEISLEAKEGKAPGQNIHIINWQSKWSYWAI